MIDVVMEFSREPGALLFMGFNQSAPHSGKSFLGQLAFRDVQARSYVADKKTVRIQSGHAYIEHPAVFSIVPPQPILDLEGFSEIKCTRVSIQPILQIFRMHPI